MKGREQPRDESLGHVTFYSKDGKLPAAVSQLVDERVPRTVKAHTNGSGGELVKGLRAEFYVHGGVDSAKVQRDAARVGAPHGAICLPAASGWLAEKLATITQIDRRDVTIVVRGGSY